MNKYDEEDFRTTMFLLMFFLCNIIAAFFYFYEHIGIGTIFIAIGLIYLYKL